MKESDVPPPETESRKLLTSVTEFRQAQQAMAQLSPSQLQHWVAQQSSGTSVTLPGELSALLTTILEIIARGATVTVGSVPEDVTTTTAAKLLGVSRPTLMKMIGNGEIPAHKVGSHTRLKSTHVLSFRRERLARQRKAFEELLELEDEG